MGINCAVTGFYHAYQRVLGQDLVDSSSTSLWTYEEPAYWTGGSGLRNLYHTAQLPLYRIPLLKHSGILGGWREREALRIAYQRTMSSARHLVARPEIGLVLLHLPVPHPPAYYDRKSGLIVAS